MQLSEIEPAVVVPVLCHWTCYSLYPIGDNYISFPCVRDCLYLHHAARKLPSHNRNLQMATSNNSPRICCYKNQPHTPCALAIFIQNMKFELFKDSQDLAPSRIFVTSLPYSLHKSCPPTSGLRFRLHQARRAIKVAVQTLPPILIWVRTEEAWESVPPIRLAILHHGQLSQKPPIHK